MLRLAVAAFTHGETTKIPSETIMSRITLFHQCISYLEVKGNLAPLGGWG